MVAQDIQQYVSRVNVFVLKTENVASIKTRYDVGLNVSHGNSNLFHDRMRKTMAQVD